MMVELHDRESRSLFWFLESKISIDKDISWLFDSPFVL